MRILHVLNSTSYSGAENVVCQIIDMFGSDKDTQMVYCSPDGPIKSSLEDRRIDFSPVKKLIPSELKKVIKKVKPDLIHAHDFRASTIVSFSAGNIPVISHLHNNYPWLKKKGVKTVLYAVTCGRYKRILTVSASVFDEFVYGDRFRDKLTVLGNPINIGAIRSKVSPQGSEKVFDLGFCGRLAAQKNPEAFVNIVASLKTRFPNLSAVMVGDGVLKNEVLSLIDEKGLGENIKLQGFQKNPYPILQSCKLMCMPSRWEGFGLAAVEALALGTPVVCSNVGGLPGIVNDECGKVCASQEEMTRECLALLSEKSRLEYKSEKAAQRASELDNIAEYKNMLSAVYAGALNIK